MAELLHVGETDFKNEVLEAKIPVLVDFGAIWCEPCKMLDPIVKQLAQAWDGKVKVFKLDVDHNSDLAMRYQVMSVPTLLLFKGGKPVERLTGFQPKERIASKFTPHLAAK